MVAAQHAAAELPYNDDSLPLLRELRFSRLSNHPPHSMLSLGTSLTNRNAAAVLRDGLARVAQGDTAVDCSALAQVDSAAVAVLLAWQRAAAGRGQALALSGVPPQLAQLAGLYGVATLLGMAPAAASAESAESTAPAAASGLHGATVPSHPEIHHRH